jgi:transposase
LDVLVFHLGLALGGRPAARFARRLMAPVSNDTLLRTVRRHGRSSFTAPRVIGIDDWAWRRNHRYGTIICDLERRRPIQLLPDREAATACEWLMQQPQIVTVARDRGGAYAQAAAKALPKATQVADRWHLMENASRAFLDAVRASIRPIRAAKAGSSLEPWLERAQSSPVASFASGVRTDLAAVHAAIVSPWSNGQTEGQITKLKLVKRQMYGRAKLDLLEARLIAATC